MKFKKKYNYPVACDLSKVGTYPLGVYSGGGYFYDEVLEYRVWTKEDDNVVCYAFGNYKDAYNFYNKHKNAEKPLVLVRQREYITELIPGDFVHVKEERIAEWQPDWLEGSQDTARQIPLFLEQNLRRA